MDTIEERILADIGIFVRDNNGDIRPVELITAEFEAQWSTLTKYRKIIAAMIILALYQRYL